MLRFVPLITLAACFAPAYVEQSPCDDTPCPSKLRCDPVTKKCVRQPADSPVDGGSDGGCDPGYTLEAGACVDIDECAASIDDCGADAACTNQAGTFTCECNPGLAGDGRTCTRACTRVVLFADCPASGTCAGVDQAGNISNAAIGLGLEVLDSGVDDEPGFRDLVDAGNFELLILDASRSGIDGDTASRVAAWVAGGGRAIITFWELNNDTTGQTMRAALGVDTVGSFTSPRDVFADPSAPVNLFDRLEQLGSPLTFSNLMIDDGDELAIATTGSIVARHSSTTGSGAIAITRDDRAITLGFLPVESGNDADEDGKPDVTELYTNMIGFLCSH